MKALRDRWTFTSRLYSREDEDYPPAHYPIQAPAEWRQIRRHVHVHDLAIKPQNYQDIYGDYREADPDHSEPDGEGFQAQFTRIPRWVRFGDDGKKRVYPVPGNDQVWFQLRKPEELTLGVPTSKVGGIWTWERPQYTFRLHLQTSQVKFSIYLPRPVEDFKKIHLPYESRGLTRQGCNLLHNGKIVAVLKRPWVRDASGRDLGPDQEERYLDVSFGQGEIVLELDDSGLIYPLTIDPPIDFFISEGADDDRVIRFYAGDQRWYNTTSYIGFGSWDATHYGYGGSMRYLGVYLPPGATINAAYVTVVAVLDLAGAVVRSDICFENSRNPGQISSYADHVGRTRTTPIAYDGIAPWTTGIAYQLPSCVSALQQVVDDNGGIGGAVIFFIEDKDMESDVAARRVFDTFDLTTYGGGRLHIESSLWGVGPGATLDRQIVNTLDDGWTHTIDLHRTDAAIHVGTFFDDPTGPDYEHDIVVRFLNCNIPQGAKIIRAYLTFTAEVSNDETYINTRIYGYDYDDALAPTSKAEVSGMDQTIAYVLWNAILAWTLDQEYNSPDISPVVQEIVDRPGYAGNALGFRWRNFASSWSYKTRDAWDYTGSPPKSAQLHVEWERESNMGSVSVMACLMGV